MEFAAKKTQNAPLGTLAERLRLDGLEISKVECPRLTSGKSILICPPRFGGIVLFFGDIIGYDLAWAFPPLLRADR